MAAAPQARGGRAPMQAAAFFGRVSHRVFAGVAVIGFGWFAACGQGDERTSMATVQKCLEDEGLQVRAAKPGPGDDDAPDRGELITRGAFIAFYSSSERAEELADAVRGNADRVHGDVARYDDVTVLYLPNAERDPIENCVEA